MRRLSLRRLSMPAAQVATVVAFLGLWQWASSSGRIDTFFFGKPSRIWSELSDWITTGTLWTNLSHTIELLAVGYLAGLVIGFALGWLMGASPMVQAILEPFVVFMNAVPRIILYPFFVVWLGFGPLPRELSNPGHGSDRRDQYRDRLSGCRGPLPVEHAGSGCQPQPPGTPRVHPVAEPLGAVDMPSYVRPRLSSGHFCRADHVE
jgi:hypothetical protein